VETRKRFHPVFIAEAILPAQKSTLRNVKPSRLGRVIIDAPQSV
jgi:hypothetical protein